MGAVDGWDVRPPRSLRLCWLLVAGVGSLLALPATGQAIAMNCSVPVGTTGAASQTPLRFGIYPGGPVGSVNPKAPPRPEDPAKRLATLQALAGSHPFVVRLYSAWTGDASADDVHGGSGGRARRPLQASRSRAEHGAFGVCGLHPRGRPPLRLRPAFRLAAGHERGESPRCARRL
jgi:hypothetical protein